MAKQAIKFTIEGADAIRKILSQIPKDINDRISYDVNRKAAAIAKKELESHAPTGQDTRSKLRIKDAVRIVKGKKAKTLVQVGFLKQLYYLFWYVRGTKVRSTEDGENRGSMDRKDFISPAFAAAVPKIVDFMGKNYLKILNRSIKKNLKRVNKGK